MLRAIVLVSSTVCLITAPASLAARHEAAPPISSSLQSAIQALGNFNYPFREWSYAPTWMPAKYSYGGGGVNADSYQVRIGKAPNYPILFTAGYFKGSFKTCQRGASKSTRLFGVSVLSDSKTAWRCWNATHGRTVRISATGGNAGSSALLKIVASARPLFPAQ